MSKLNLPKNNFSNIANLKLKSNNKKIFLIDQKYKRVFKTIIDKFLYKYKGIPLNWEDIYYLYLFRIPDLINKYDESLNIPLKTFLGIKCNHFSSNLCRTFSNNKYKILNNYFPFEKIENFNLKHNIDNIEIPINTSKLNKIELIIYKEYFIEGKKINSIKKNIKISGYKIKSIIKSIKIKLIDQIKN